jgi:two-component system nitrogen regulation sensor histidine kinase NtrY
LAADPKTRTPLFRRRTTVIILALAIFILFLLIFSQAAFNLNPVGVRPETPFQTLLFAGISALIFLLLLVLTFVLIRTLLKLYLERQTGVLGSKFRTKMVLGALVLSFGPVIALFLFSYGLMNRSIDRWFSRPAEEVREHTSAVTSLLSGYAGQNAKSEAQAIAESPNTAKAFHTGNFGNVMEEFRRRDITLQGGFALAILDEHAEAVFHAPDTWNVLRAKLPKIDALEKKPQSFVFQGHEYMVAAVPVGTDGTIVVAMPLPTKYSDALRELENSERKYVSLRSERKLIRQTYMQLLLLLTVLVLFAATWFALYLSKLVTRPVSALATAMHEISSGRLDYRVDVPAGDELAELVGSFNKMASELESNRKQIDASSQQLATANKELDQRRRYMETILESIPTGVLSLDAAGRITRMNTALHRMFPQTDALQVSQSTLRDLFSGDVITDIERMMRKADRMRTTTSQMEIPGTIGSATTVAVTVASMDARTYPPQPRVSPPKLGYVLVFEDISDLLRAQKQAAWREVARRIAHEIKNPLTPIQLSAERIRRHLSRGNVDDSASILKACAETISSSVDTVRTLVDEFSSLARFPASQPQPSDLNAIIESALAMFDGRLAGIDIVRSLAADLPRVMADPEAMKRVVANLVDNAAEAMQHAMVREITISTAVVGARDAVELVVADSGHGVTPELKEKLFLPYFSTKQRGTGLGLAIVSRIVEDHHGTIRVEENKPLGARFIVELPIAVDVERPEPSSVNVEVTPARDTQTQT